MLPDRLVELKEELKLIGQQIQIKVYSKMLIPMPWIKKTMIFIVEFNYNKIKTFNNLYRLSSFNKDIMGIIEYYPR